MLMLKFKIFLLFAFLSIFIIIFYINFTNIGIEIIKKTKINMIHYPSSNLCDDNYYNIDQKFIFAYIFVRANDFEKRRTIRKTYANQKFFPNFQIVFIIGISKIEKNNYLIKIEQDKHNDLIQGDFIDSSRNLSYKSLIAWKWLTLYSNNCLKAYLILKIDDDVVLNTFRLVKFLHSSSDNTFFCNFDPNPTVVCRDKVNCGPLNYVTYDEYNKKLYDLKDYYSTFCSG
jgi:hypothetical protein